MEETRRIKVISLFCGCGGADLGVLGGFKFLGEHYKKHPTEIVHASDIDSKAVRTYNRNFDHKALVSDIKDIDFRGLDGDVVIGGFPCQDFSTVNPNKMPDKKENQLFWQMCRVLKEVRPKIFIAENVKGFYRLNGGAYFEMAKRAFDKEGYNVYSLLMNASNYGIPQLRERLIMVGIRKRRELGPFVFPRPTHGYVGLGKMKPSVPLKAVINSLRHHDKKYYFSKRAVEGVKKAKKNMKRALAQDMNKPCLTITSHLAKVSLNSRDPVLLVDPKKELYRRFTPTEAARIQSFPDSFVFEGSEGDAYRQIGNAVPPVLMWHVMKAVIRQFFMRSNVYAEASEIENLFSSRAPKEQSHPTPSISVHA